MVVAVHDVNSQVMKMTVSMQPAKFPPREESPHLPEQETIRCYLTNAILIISKLVCDFGKGAHLRPAYV